MGLVFALMIVTISYSPLPYQINSLLFLGLDQGSANFFYK